MSTKLYYFDARGLCEPIRMIFAIGGVEYEDIRAPMPLFKLDPSVEFVRPELPNEIKEKARWGQVPFVELEGKQLTQSNAIGRYFAKKFKLVGSDDFEAALCDEYVDTTREILIAFTPVAVEREPEKRKEMIEQMKKTVGEKYLSKFNSIVEANGGKRLVGKSLTWADITLAHVLRQGDTVIPEMEITKDYPALKTLVDTVFSIPEIKNWVEKRPKTYF